MNRKILKWLLVATALFVGAPAYGQQVNLYWRSGSGVNPFAPVTTANPLPVAATITPAGTQDVNLTQILGAAPSLTNPLWVFPATGATFPVSGTVTAAQATAANLNATVVGTGTFLVQAAQSGTWTVTGAGGTFPVTQSTSPWIVSNSGTFATQSAITAASGSFASGSQPIGITPTDRTVTSATGSSQTVASALATRKSLLIVNTGNANCGINPTGGTAAIGGAGTITLTPTGSYSPRIPTLSAVTAICTAGQPLYAEES